MAKRTYSEWSKSELNDKIELYWLMIYDIADKRDDKELLRIAFAIKQLLKHRDIQL